MTTARNSRVLRTIPLLIAVCLVSFPAQAQYGGGTGEPNDPYQIYTAEQMNAIGAEQNDWDRHFKLMADIDLDDLGTTSFNPIGYYRNPGDWKQFTGVFDGNGHRFLNFHCISSDERSVGLFGYVNDPNSEIKDLELIDPNVIAESGESVGALVGALKQGTVSNCGVRGGSVLGSRAVAGLVGGSFGTIINCYSTCAVTGIGEVGGLVGYNAEAITDSYCIASVAGDFDVGGLVGYNDGGTVAQSYSTSTVGGDSYVGGLVGTNYFDSTVTQCYSTGDVTGNKFVGGLVGYNVDTITYSYYMGRVFGDMRIGGVVGDNYGNGMIISCNARGEVSGREEIGGLVGHNWGTILDCYSTTRVVGSEVVGGLIGRNKDKVSRCYSVGNVSGDSEVGGLIGNLDPNGSALSSFWDIESSGQATSAGGTGKTTDEMQDLNTFMLAGWDFIGQIDGPSDIWVLSQAGEYPILWWELPSLPSLPSFSGGTGEPNNPFLISTVEELNHIGHNPRLMNAHFNLTNDIDLTDVNFFVIGSREYPFTGVFQGSEMKILNLRYAATDRDYVGLFGFVYGGEIKDLGLVDPNTEAGEGFFVGSVVGYLKSGTIKNCYVKNGKVSGYQYIGGLVGCISEGTVSNCHSTGTFSGDSRVGGLVGSNYGGTVAQSYSTGVVTGTRWHVGGLVGQIWEGTVSNCHSTSAVRGDSYVGGLIGRSNFSDVTNCYSTGAISGGGDVGGLAGYNDRGSITTSYSTGTVTGTRWHVGGLVGYNFLYDALIQCCYSTGAVSGDSYVGGLVGGNDRGAVIQCYSTGTVTATGWRVGGLVGSGEPDYVAACFWDTQTSGQPTSAGGTGKITAEMQTSTTFLAARWDFVDETANGTEDIWWILKGRDYPRLWWELIPEN